MDTSRYRVELAPEEGRGGGGGGGERGWEGKGSGVGGDFSSGVRCEGGRLK